MSQNALPSPPSYRAHSPSPSESSLAPSTAVPSSEAPPSFSDFRTDSQLSSDASHPQTTSSSSLSVPYVPGTPRSEDAQSTDGATTSAGGSTLSTSAEPGPSSGVHVGWIGDDGRPGVVRIEDEADTLPPSYDESRTLNEPTTFTFSSHSFNSMLLVPPSDAADTRPLFYVSVAMNCFNPSSYVTTVYRGGSDTGQWIGEFEMGISAVSGTVTYGDTTKKISAVLQKDGSKNSPNGTWTYNFSSRSPTLLWRWGGNTMNCYILSLGSFKPRHLAFFSGTQLDPLQSGGRRVPPSTLKLWPEGYERGMIGHIVLSALIIERKRLYPAVGDAKRLFS